MTIGDVALPRGSTSQGVDLTQASARTRARVANTDGEINSLREVPVWARRVGAVAVAAWVVTRQDVAGAWPWRSTPPSLRDLMAEDVKAGVPGNHAGFAAGAVVWRRTVAIPATAVLYVVAWLLQHPARALPASAIVGALLILWIL